MPYNNKKKRKKKGNFDTSTERQLYILICIRTI